MIEKPEYAALGVLVMTRTKVLALILFAIVIGWGIRSCQTEESDNPARPAQSADSSDPLTPLSQCVDQEARNGAYSSFDDGQSVVAIINGKCRIPIYAYIPQQCDNKIGNEKDTCTQRAYLT